MSEDKSVQELIADRVLELLEASGGKRVEVSLPYLIRTGTIPVAWQEINDQLLAYCKAAAKLISDRLPGTLGVLFTDLLHRRPDGQLPVLTVQYTFFVGPLHNPLQPHVAA